MDNSRSADDLIVTGSSLSNTPTQSNQGSPKCSQAIGHGDDGSSSSNSVSPANTSPLRLSLGIGSATVHNSYSNSTSPLCLGLGIGTGNSSENCSSFGYFQTQPKEASHLSLCLGIGSGDDNYSSSGKPYLQPREGRPLYLCLGSGSGSSLGGNRRPLGISLGIENGGRGCKSLPLGSQQSQPKVGSLLTPVGQNLRNGNRSGDDKGSSSSNMTRQPWLRLLNGNNQNLWKTNNPTRSNPPTLGTYRPPNSCSHSLGQSSGTMESNYGFGHRGPTAVGHNADVASCGGKNFGNPLKPKRVHNWSGYAASSRSLGGNVAKTSFFCSVCRQRFLRRRHLHSHILLHRYYLSRGASSTICIPEDSTTVHQQENDRTSAAEEKPMEDEHNQEVKDATEQRSDD